MQLGSLLRRPTLIWAGFLAVASPGLADAPRSAAPAAPASSDEILTLQEFRVSSSAESGYKPDSAYSGTKTNTSLRDTPQSVTVVTSQMLSDEQAVNFNEALTLNDASLQRQNSPFGDHDNFVARGTQLSISNSYLRNGRFAFYLTQPPIESMERLEVVKGPASVLYGAGPGGAMINVITKVPPSKPLLATDLLLGAYDYRKAMLDVGAPLLDGGRLGYRAVVSYEDSGSFRDFMYTRRKYAYTAFKWKPLSTTTVVFNFDALSDVRSQDSGTVAFGDHVFEVPWHEVFNNRWGGQHARVLNAGFNSVTDLSANWRLYAGYNFQYYNRSRIDNLPFGTVNQTTGDFSLRVSRFRSRVHYHTWTGDLVGQEDWGATHHVFLFGFDYTHDYNSVVPAQTNVVLTQNIFHPVYVPVEPATTQYSKPNRIIDLRGGAYASDQIKIKRFDFLFTARLEHSNGISYNEYQNQTASSAKWQRINQVIPRAGVVYHVTSDLGLYASYNEGLETAGFASRGTNIGQQLSPITSKSYEAGTKIDLLNRKLAFTAAVFVMRRRGDAFYDSTRDLTVQTGESFRKGVEAAITGQITHRWNVNASVMMLSAKYGSDANAANTLDGVSIPGIAHTVYTLWTSYRFAPTSPLNGFEVNVGGRHESAQRGDLTNSFTLPSDTVIDAGVAYTIPQTHGRLTVKLNVNNMLNERYYFLNSVIGRTTIGIGDPREWRLDLHYGF